MTPSPYQPPVEPGNAVRSNSVENDDRLAKIGLSASVGSFVAPVIILGLVLLGVLSVHWDSLFTPLLTLELPIPLAIAGFWICIVARLRRRSWNAAIGMWVAVAAIPLSIAIAWLLAMAGLATHPV